jgi:hypothetical protein
LFIEFLINKKLHNIKHFFQQQKTSSNQSERVKKAQFIIFIAKLKYFFIEVVLFQSGQINRNIFPNNSLINATKFGSELKIQLKRRKCKCSLKGSGKGRGDTE